METQDAIATFFYPEPFPLTAAAERSSVDSGHSAMEGARRKEAEDPGETAVPAPRALPFAVEVCLMAAIPLISRAVTSADGSALSYKFARKM